MSAQQNPHANIQRQINDLGYTINLIKGCFDALELLSPDLGLDAASAQSSAFHGLVGGAMELVNDGLEQCENIHKMAKKGL